MKCQVEKCIIKLESKGMSAEEIIEIIKFIEENRLTEEQLRQQNQIK